MHYIGIDIGSTYIKSALFDIEKGKIEAVKSVPFPGRIETKNRRAFAVPAGEILMAVRKQAESYAETGSEIRGLIFSTQMHGFVYHTNTEEDLYISWQDMRCLDEKDGRRYLDILTEKIDRKEMESHGVYIKPSLGLCNLYTMLEEGMPGNGELFTLGSYIISGMTGVNQCHLMNAAPLGLADIKAGCWDWNLIRKLGFQQIRFPKIVERDTEICGFWHFKGKRIPVYPDFGDQQCAILGSMAGWRDAVINIATAAQVSIRTRSFCPGSYEIRPYFKGQYINTVSNMPSGRNLDVLIDFFGSFLERIKGVKLERQKIWEIVLQNYCGDSRGISLDMNFFEMNGRRGAIKGITNMNLTMESLFAAAFENMADTYWENVKRLAGEKEIYQIVCAGGVSWKRPELLEKIRECSGKRCVRSALPDEALNGLYRIALLCEKICIGLDDRPDLVLGK